MINLKHDTENKSSDVKNKRIKGTIQGLELWASIGVICGTVVVLFFIFSLAGPKLFNLDATIISRPPHNIIDFFPFFFAVPGTIISTIAFFSSKYARNPLRVIRLARIGLATNGSFIVMVGFVLLIDAIGKR